MPVDRGAAISACHRIRDGITRRDNTSYMMSDLTHDAQLAVDYLLGAPEKEAKPAEVVADNPITTEFLSLIGWADPTTNGNVWTIQDLDGRELKYVFVDENTPDMRPELYFLDNEGEGGRLPHPPETEGEMLFLCKMWKFPITIPN